MRQDWETLLAIYRRTREAVQEFVHLLHPIIEQAQNDHERLYYHHILEEEEHHLQRLDRFLPHLEKRVREADGEPLDQRDDVILLQYLALETFGLHNFVEHLDLALYEFKDPPIGERLRQLRMRAYQDYVQTKEITRALVGQEAFDHDDEELRPENSPIAASSSERSAPMEPAPAPPLRPNRRERRFTVGSLIGR